MKIRFAPLVITLLLAGVVAGQQSSKDLVRNAKTLYISAPEGPSMDLKAEAIKKLAKWGKLTLVTDADKADLVLKLELTRGFSQWKGKGARGTAELADRQTSTMLWATSEGGDFSMAGYSNGKVGRKIADKFIEYYQKQTK